jgi:hypothetical protein
VEMNEFAGRCFTYAVDLGKAEGFMPGEVAEALTYAAWILLRRVHGECDGGERLAAFAASLYEHQKARLAH